MCVLARAPIANALVKLMHAMIWRQSPNLGLLFLTPILEHSIISSLQFEAGKCGARRHSTTTSEGARVGQTLIVSALNTSSPLYYACVKRGSGRTSSLVGFLLLYTGVCGDLRILYSQAPFLRLVPKPRPTNSIT